MYTRAIPWGLCTCLYIGRPGSIADDFWGELPGEVENTYINIRNGHGSGRDRIAPLVAVGEGQTMHHIKAENKGLKAMRLS